MRHWAEKGRKGDGDVGRRFCGCVEAFLRGVRAPSGVEFERKGLGLWGRPKTLLDVDIYEEVGGPDLFLIPFGTSPGGPRCLICLSSERVWSVFFDPTFYIAALFSSTGVGN